MASSCSWSIFFATTLNIQRVPKKGHVMGQARLSLPQKDSVYNLGVLRNSLIIMLKRLFVIMSRFYLIGGALL